MMLVIFDAIWLVLLAAGVVIIFIEYYFLDTFVGNVIDLSVDDKGRDVSVAFKLIYYLKDKKYIKSYIRCYYVKGDKKKALLEKINNIESTKAVDVYTIKNSAYLYRTEIDKPYIHLALTLIISSIVVFFISFWINH